MLGVPGERQLVLENGLTQEYRETTFGVIGECSSTGVMTYCRRLVCVSRV